MGRTQGNPVGPPSRIRRWSRRALIALTVLLVAAELTARFALGLGDPPLMMTDPQIEYLYQPSKSYKRFGNSVRFNSFSMRSEEFTKRKSDSAEFRVIILGDSVINGGSWTNQDETAAELLKAKLHDHYRLRAQGRPIMVGNVSAPSWGPPNLLAYVQRFGLFDADAVILVLGSEDYGDVPDFKPLSIEGPERPPLCALHEALQRYVPMIWRHFRDGSVPPKPFEARAEDIEASLYALRQLIDAITQTDAHLLVGMHMERTEITSNTPKPGYAAIKRVLENRQIPIVEFGPLLGQAIRAKSDEPFRDYVHPSAAGQKIMADAMFQWIIERLPSENLPADADR
jgi:hypothetical protein